MAVDVAAVRCEYASQHGRDVGCGLVGCGLVGCGLVGCDLVGCGLGCLILCVSGRGFCSVPQTQQSARLDALAELRRVARELLVSDVPGAWSRAAVGSRTRRAPAAT